MAVLISADVPGQTKEGYEQMLTQLSPLLRDAKGFIAHGAGPSGNGWRVFEVWDTAEDATQFFARYIQPTLPAGVKPKRTYVELHTLIKM